MKLYAFLDWNTINSSPVVRAYGCDWRENAKWQIPLSATLLVVVALLLILLGNRAFGTAPGMRSSVPTQQSAATLELTSLPDNRGGGDARNTDTLATAASTGTETEPGGQSAESANLRPADQGWGPIASAFFWITVCGLSAIAILLPLSSYLQRIVIQWDGTNQLIVTSWRLWPVRRRWSKKEVGGIAFGIREQVDRVANRPSVHRGWFWFVHINGQQLGGKGRGHTLVEFLIAHQEDRPATDAGRAFVPHRVKDFTGWLESCIGLRMHGPVLVADKKG